jgi:Leucine-rich repeat (LRR) protein
VSRRCMEATETLSLDLSGCGLMKVPDAIFVLLKQVKDEVHTVDFRNNQLSAIGKKLTQFSRLRELRLAGNPIMTIAESLSELQAIRVLDLSGCRLAHIPGAVFGLTSLEHLLLGQNELNEFDTEPFRRLTNLRTLVLADNPALTPRVILALRNMPLHLRLS